MHPFPFSFWTPASDAMVAVKSSGGDFWLQLDGALSASDSRLVLASAWFRAPNGSGDRVNIFEWSAGDSDDIFRLYRNQADDRVYVLVYLGSTGTILLEMRSTITITDTSWHHVLVAVDVSADALCRLYIDGVDRTDILERASATMDWNDATASSSTVRSEDGNELAEIYVAPGQWLDLSVSSNREKFRTSGGDPVDLGPTGSLPTGVQPAIYMSWRDDGEWGRNIGALGDFSFFGTFTHIAVAPPPP